MNFARVYGMNLQILLAKELFVKETSYLKINTLPSGVNWALFPLFYGCFVLTFCFWVFICDFLKAGNKKCKNQKSIL